MSFLDPFSPAGFSSTVRVSRSSDRKASSSPKFYAKRRCQSPPRQQAPTTIPSALTDFSGTDIAARIRNILTTGASASQ